MKKIILLALTALMVIGCTYTKEETIKNMSVDGYILKEIDSCEYFMVHISSYMDGGVYDIQCGIGSHIYDLKYVHQLQHALRLCGIDKEIIL